VCALVGTHGMKSWSFIARQLKGRLGKQCRERYISNVSYKKNQPKLYVFLQCIEIIVSYQKLVKAILKIFDCLTSS
jgi:hypothetical protein